MQGALNFSWKLPFLAIGGNLAVVINVNVYNLISTDKHACIIWICLETKLDS